jgi:2-polyprenyl-3-methyl-5-hydroxy-6-metoxy-1,4-benzoquinol methylase
VIATVEAPAAAAIRCPVCGSAEHEVVFDLGPAANPLCVPGAIARCRRCPMWFKILTDPGRLSEAYSDAYAENERTDDYMTGPAARAFFRRVLEQLGGVDRSVRPSLLDIGAGQGALVEEAEALGYDTLGIDRCEPLARRARARGLRVECTTGEDLQGAALFDVVTMMDVIEHVPDPRRLLATARRLLKPRGRLVVYTPNHRGAVVMLAKALHALGAGVAVREIFGGNHVCFFDDRSLPLALLAEGFTVDALRLFPYDPSRPGGPVSRASLAAVTAVEWLGKPFNRTFRMLALATREL